MTTGARITGTCKWFNSVMGYGFLTSTTGEEYFVHQSAIKNSGFRNLAKDEEVEFSVSIEPDTNKQKAVDVTGPGGIDVKGEDARPSQRQNRGGFNRPNYNGAPRSNYNDRGYERRDDFQERRNERFDGDKDRNGNFSRGGSPNFRGRGGYNSRGGARNPNWFNRGNEPRDFESGWRR